jgi:hypothetical protein
LKFDSRVSRSVRWGVAASLMLASALACTRSAPDGSTRERVPRPAARMGRILLADVPEIGRISGISGGGEGALLVGGTEGAAIVTSSGQARLLGGRKSSFALNPVAGLDPDRPTFLGRAVDGSLGWVGADGKTRARMPKGAHDMAVGHLDADGALDLIVGLPKRQGIRRLDELGRTVWTAPDVDPWQVTLTPPDPDRGRSIVHSNRNGLFVVRDSDGDVRSWFHTGWPAKHFALVRWPRLDGEVLVLQRRGDAVALHQLDGSEHSNLIASVANDAERVEAVAFDPRGDGNPWLAVLDHLHEPGPTTLTVFDQRGRPVHEEVFLDGCGALGELARDGRQELILGCGSELWRYGTLMPRDHVPLSVGEARAGGDVIGPLRFGDPVGRVRALRTLMEGHACRNVDCDTSWLELDRQFYVLVPEFDQGKLDAVVLLGMPEPAESFDDGTRESWEELRDLVIRQVGPADPGSSSFPSSRDVDHAPPEDGWRIVDTHRWTREERTVVLGIATVDEPGAVQYVPYVRVDPPAGSATHVVR